MREEKEGLRVFVKVMPGASCNKIEGVVEGADHRTYLKVKLSQVPEDGKANAALLKYLACCWRVPISSMQLVRGQSSRFKEIFIYGASISDVGW